MDTLQKGSPPSQIQGNKFVRWFKKHWKPIVSISALILVIVAGYLIVAGTGAPKFGKIGEVAGNFK